MSDEDFLIKYQDLLNKAYCDCNEMNCIDNNSPRRILNIAIKQHKEIERLNNVINVLERHLHQEILEWQDSDDDFIKAQVQEDRIILDYLKELKEMIK